MITDGKDKKPSTNGTWLDYKHFIIYLKDLFRSGRRTIFWNDSESKLNSFFCIIFFNIFTFLGINYLKKTINFNLLI